MILFVGICIQQFSWKCPISDHVDQVTDDSSKEANEAKRSRARADLYKRSSQSSILVLSRAGVSNDSPKLQFFFNLQFVKVSCHCHLLLVSHAVRIAGQISAFSVSQPFHVAETTLDKEPASLVLFPYPSVYHREAIKLLQASVSTLSRVGGGDKA